MRYVLAFIVPPLAIFLCKRWGHFTINLIFWIISIPLCFFGIGVIVWLICIAHALAVCKVSSIDKRIDRVVKAIESRTHADSGAPNQQL